MKQYDYLIVGAGLFGAVFAQEARRAGKRCLVIDRRDHIAGNIYTEQVEGINVHRYGAHIFHTNSKEVPRLRPRSSASGPPPASPSPKTWRSRPSAWWAPTSMRNW